MEISEFDTNYTLLIKKANEFEIPTKYVLYINNDYESLFDKIGQYISEKDNIIEIFKKLNPYLKNLLLADFYMAYLTVDIQEFKSTYEKVLEKINSLISEINEDDGQYFGVYAQNQNDLPLFDNTQTLQEDYSIWARKFNQDIANDNKAYQKVIASEKILTETQPINFNYESIDIESEKLLFRPKLINNQEITYEDGIEIFNSMVPSINIPFIQYNDNNNKSYYKVFEDPNLNFDSVIPNASELRKRNHIYFVVSIVKDIKDVKISGSETIKKNYVKCSYNLSNNQNKLIVKDLYIKDEELIISRIKDCFKYLNLGEYKKTNLKGKFNIQDLQLNFAIFHFLVFNDDQPDLQLNSIFSNYIFIDETKSSTVNRPAMTIKYRTIDEEEDEEEDEVQEESLYNQYQTPSSLTLTFQEYSNSFRFIKVKNIETLGQFLKIFTRLLTIYKDYEDSVKEEIFYRVLPELKNVEKVTTMDNLDERTKKVNLNNAFPEVFYKGANGYSRLCNCERQPILVDDELEEKDWKNKSFVRGFDSYERQVAMFPPKKEEMLFKYVCPDDAHPYPSLIKNNTEENSEKYPYIPCCGDNDTLKNFEKEYYNLEKDKGKVYKTYEINTIKVLDYKRTGKVPLQIQTLLSSVYKDEKYEFNRWGTYRSPNSLIHCIMMALQLQSFDPDVETYQKLENNEQREEFCKTIRKKMISNFPDLAIYHQEIFDIQTEEIFRILSDPNEFLDPALFYRGLEELYNVNIFVFKPTLDSSSESSIEIPRHKFTHIRPERIDRDTILVFKHEGGESEDLKYPQCELIFNSGKIKEAVVEKEKSKNLEKKGRGRPKKEDKETQAIVERSKYFFGKEITTLMFSSLEKFNKNYIFSFDIGNKKKIQTRLNPYSKINYDTIFRSPMKIISQTTDGYGKTRSFNIEIAQYKITVYVPPTQPYNLPISKEVFISEVDVVKTIFGEPKKIIDEGLWYSIIDYEYGIFIPCNTNSKISQPEAPLELTITSNPIKEYRNIRKLYNIFIDLVIWGLRSNGIINLKDFSRFEKFVKIVDSIDYNIGPTILDIRLPENQNFTFLHDWWPNYFTSNNKVKMTNSLYEKVKAYLKRYYTETDGLSLAPNKYLQGVFEYEGDFTQYLNSRVIIGKEHLENWKKQRKLGISSEVKIYKDLSKSSLLLQEEPFLYMDESKKNKPVYIIQNVKGGSKNKALYVAKIWRDSKYNLGYDVMESDDVESIVPTVINIITPSYKIVYAAQENFEEKTKDYIQIVYNKLSGYYHAMLPSISILQTN